MLNKINVIDPVYSCPLHSKSQVFMNFRQKFPSCVADHKSADLQLLCVADSDIRTMNLNFIHVLS